MIKRFIFFVFFGLALEFSFAQIPFEIFLEPVTVPGLGGLQSYAFGEHEGKWLIVGGRLDGLHRRQPWASFDLAGHNDQLWVVDPVGLQSWSASLEGLPVEVQEQLRSTNLEFYQEGDQLYLVGGYGYSSSQDDHITFPHLAAIQVPQTIDAVINGTAVSPYIRQISDEAFAVTGGHLSKIYDSFYLVGGHRFDGRYNPMGHPTHIQTYTNAIHRFQLDDDGTDLVYLPLGTITNEEDLHRRDYNLMPQILPDGTEGLTAFSGVFQIGADLPYLNSVTIDSNGYQVNYAFSQYFNHYHCANLGLYSSVRNEMYNLFFGGIAQYYEQDGALVQDDEVPFVKTIAVVKRRPDGTLSEHKLPIEMPAYLGAGSEFIPNPSLPLFPNGVLKLDELPTDTLLIGYIFGGIASSEKNIFWINDGSQSEAANQLFGVWILPGDLVGVTTPITSGERSLELNVFPNPNNGRLNVEFYLSFPGEIMLTLTDEQGRTLAEERYAKGLYSAGPQQLVLEIPAASQGRWFLVTLTANGRQMTKKVIWGE